MNVLMPIVTAIVVGPLDLGTLSALTVHFATILLILPATTILLLLGIINCTWSSTLESPISCYNCTLISLCSATYNSRFSSIESYIIY